MEKEVFISKIEKEATDYAFATIYEPNEHMDAVESAVCDYLTGAYKAYELVTGDVIEFEEEGDYCQIIK